ncbi:hypothetical protein Nepgr_013423 [Nepenthes gracilis]|uniref:Uncharacterized protein n=1 Tax=Nepenthes gracilis TaxID=150966 RepID=A0AAD3SJ41_NEPGR|nr:hypothetical protein Nepgr_013423 [Nepenthes gracilis]
MAKYRRKGHINRLKPQQLVLASKANKKPKSKKNRRKTKQVASINFLGSLVFILLLGRLVPIVDVSHRGIGDMVNISDPQKGMVFPVGGPVNGTDQGGSVGLQVGKFFHENRYCKGIHCRRLKSDKE